MRSRVWRTNIRTPWGGGGAGGTMQLRIEVFNVFNHENYGSYTTQESSASYGQPSFNSNLAYQARMLQLGFRFAF